MVQTIADMQMADPQHTLTTVMVAVSHMVQAAVHPMEAANSRMVVNLTAAVNRTAAAAVNPTVVVEAIHMAAAGVEVNPTAATITTKNQVTDKYQAAEHTSSAAFVLSRGRVFSGQSAESERPRRPESRAECPAAAR